MDGRITYIIFAEETAGAGLEEVILAGPEGDESTRVARRDHLSCRPAYVFPHGQADVNLVQKKNRPSNIRNT